ncbi:MAG: hypothetical protein MZU97_00115 [Bacillus subtilis]|nr:hypothetical protein [Bacillus subtilis]
MSFDFAYNRTIRGSYQDVLAKRSEVLELQKAVKELEKSYTAEREKKLLATSIITYRKSKTTDSSVGSTTSKLARSNKSSTL